MIDVTTLVNVPPFTQAIQGWTVLIRAASPVAKADGLSITKPPSGGYLPRYRLFSLLQQALRPSARLIYRRAYFLSLARVPAIASNERDKLHFSQVLA